MKKDSIINSVLSIFRFIAIAVFALLAQLIIQFAIYKSINSGLMNYAIAISIILASLVSVKILDKKPIYYTGLSIGKKNIIYFVSGVIIAIMWFFIFTIVVSIKNKENLFIPSLILLANNKRNIFSLLAIPLAEEAFYRGYLLNNTFTMYNFGKRNILIALIFAVPHMFNAEKLTIEVFILAFILCTFLFGILFNILSQITKSIWLGLGFHWFYNYFVSNLYQETKNYTIVVISTTILLIICIALSIIVYKKKKVKKLL